MTLITLQQIRDCSIPGEGWAKLLDALGNPSDLSMKVSFGDIAKSNGAQDAMWCLRALDWHDAANRRFASSLVMPSIRRASKRTTDKQTHDCIKAIETWLKGDDSVDLVAAATATLPALRAANDAPYVADTADADDAERAAITAIYITAYLATLTEGILFSSAFNSRAPYATMYSSSAAAANAAFAVGESESQQQADDIIEKAPLYALAGKE